MSSNTPNLNLLKKNPVTDGDDTFNIDTMLNENWDKTDAKFGATIGHGHTGVAGDGPRITASGLANGSATDTVIGNRTITDTTAPTGDTAAPTTLFSWLGYMIKSITGGATWRTAPGMTIAAIKTILDAAVSIATPSTLIKRDAAGRAQVVAPSAAGDVAIKSTVDAAQAAAATDATNKDTALQGVINTALALKAPLASPVFSGIATFPTAANGTNTLQAANTAFVQAAIALLMDSAPGALDTLNELAAAMGDDPNFAATVTNALALKLPIASYTAADVLAKLLTVDSNTSGLNSNYLQGYVTGNTLNTIPLNNNTMNIGLNAEMLGGAKIAEIPKQTTAVLTYYVRTDGLDTNTGLANTTGAAFKTITKAISMIPRTVNHTAVIQVAAGTYTEIVTVAGFVGAGELQIIGDSVVSTSRSVNSIVMKNNTIFVTVNGFNCLTPSNTSAVEVSASLGALVNNINSVVASTGTGITLNLSNIRATGCNISNKGKAFSFVNASIGYIENTTGTGNAVVTESVLGSYAAVVGTRPTGTIDDSIFSGAIINHGTGVVNPWGDNTYVSRPIVWANPSVDHPMTASTYTTIKYAAVFTNQNSGYNGTTGVFTSPSTGWYKVKASGLVSSVPATIQCQLRVLQNGVSGYTIDVRNAGSVNMHVLLAGEILLYLPYGEYFTIQAWSATAQTLTGGNDLARLEIIRVA